MLPHRKVEVLPLMQSLYRRDTATSIVISTIEKLYYKACFIVLFLQHKECSIDLLTTYDSKQGVA
jgi:hypothetical protein